jgi:four helix bundle protein
MKTKIGNSPGERLELEVNFKFEKLDVWKEAIEFAKKVYKVTKDFPKNEQFGLGAQMRNAATSIPSNISEGSVRGHDKDFTRFLRIALGSTFEIVSQLYISLNENYLTKANFNDLYSHAFKIANMISALIKRLE